MRGFEMPCVDRGLYLPLPIRITMQSVPHNVILGVYIRLYGEIILRMSNDIQVCKCESRWERLMREQHMAAVKVIPFTTTYTCDRNPWL